jgi:hypothetical protein
MDTHIRHCLDRMAEVLPCHIKEIKKGAPSPTVLSKVSDDLYIIASDLGKIAKHLRKERAAARRTRQSINRIEE